MRNCERKDLKNSNQPRGTKSKNMEETSMIDLPSVVVDSGARKEKV